MPERSVKLARDFRLSRTVTKSKLQFTEKKNGGHLKRGGTLQCPPVRSGRPLTLRTEAGLVGEEQTNRPGARAVRTHLLRRFISAIIQTSKIFHLHAPPVGLHSAAEDTKKPWNIGD